MMQCSYFMLILIRKSCFCDFYVVSLNKPPPRVGASQVVLARAHTYVTS